MTIDDRLAALGTADVHPGLGMIDDGVFARIDADAKGRRQARYGVTAVICAATLAGMTGAALPMGRPADQGADFSSIALAPSTLLGSEG